MESIYKTTAMNTIVTAKSEQFQSIYNDRFSTLVQTEITLPKQSFSK